MYISILDFIHGHMHDRSLEEVQLFYFGVVIRNHWRLDCLLNHLFGHRSKKILKLRATGLREGISPMTGEFPAHRVSNVEYVFILLSHHGIVSAAFSILFVQMHDELLWHYCDVKWALWHLK